MVSTKHDRNQSLKIHYAFYVYLSDIQRLCKQIKNSNRKIVEFHRCFLCIDCVWCEKIEKKNVCVAWCACAFARGFDSIPSSHTLHSELTRVRCDAIVFTLASTSFVLIKLFDSIHVNGVKVIEAHTQRTHPFTIPFNCNFLRFISIFYFECTKSANHISTP